MTQHLPRRNEPAGDLALARSFAAALKAERQDLLDSIASGNTSFQQAAHLARNSVGLHRLFVLKACEALPGIGKVRSRRTLDSLGIEHETAFGSLSEQDIDLLYQALIMSAPLRSPGAKRP